MAGGFGAQLITALIVNYLRESGSKVLVDASYFSTRYRSNFNKELKYFNYALQKETIHINKFERSYFFQKLSRMFFRLSKKVCLKNVYMMDDQSEGKIRFILNNMNTIRKNNTFKNVKRIEIGTVPTTDKEVVVHMRRTDFHTAKLEILNIETLQRLVKKKYLPFEKSITIVTDDKLGLKKECDSVNMQDIDVISGDLLDDIKVGLSAKILVLSRSQFSILMLLFSKKVTEVYLPHVFFNEIDKSIPLKVWDYSKI